MNVTDVLLEATSTTINCTWRDPTSQAWNATSIVVNATSPPKNITDGDRVVTTYTKNKHSKEPFIIDGLSPSTKYYIGIFPNSQISRGAVYSYDGNVFEATTRSGGGGTGGTSYHDELDNLGFEESKHVGFQKELTVEELADIASIGDKVSIEDLTFQGEKITTTTVGDLVAGTNLDGNTVLDVISKMILAEQFPTLSNPSSTFTSTAPALIEFNTTRSITFTARFNPGSISPQYTAESPNRAGAPTSYVYTGEGIPESTTSSQTTDTKTLTNYRFDTLGSMSWTNKVNYGQGVQPKSSEDNDYGTPLPAGTTQVKTVSTIVVNPIYATTSMIGSLAKQTLVAPTVSYIETSMVDETDTEKQTLQFGKEMGTLTRVDQLNTLSGKWETIALSSFTVNSIVKNVNGIDQDYFEVIHNGSKSGARSLRFYI